MITRTTKEVWPGHARFFMNFFTVKDGTVTNHNKSNEELEELKSILCDMEDAGHTILEFELYMEYYPANSTDWVRIDLEHNFREVAENPTS